ncbi:hypothetical protein BH11MYX1_BH11MYX1_45930 [soil metagenome]
MLGFTAARILLVLHTALGVSAVAAGTHLVIWLRRYLRGAAGRRRSVLKFAWIFFALQLCAFGAGNLMYPTYRVEVRSAYLENAAAVSAQADLHSNAVATLEARSGQTREAPATVDLVRRAAKAARWFDVKEHWIALGLFVSAALLLVLSMWDPDRDGMALAPIAMGFAVLAAGTVWLGAIIGVLTAAWRAV